MNHAQSPGLRTAKGRGTLRDRFNAMADAATRALGSIQAVVLSVVVVIVWALSGPLFGFSDSWQLVINTSTTVITFWMVFVIQNSQGRDARAIHLKLDEIIRANAEARNEFIVAERATEAEVEARERELQRVVEEAPATPGPAAGSDAR
jgi:low affinity Fe/Cu permease